MDNPHHILLFALIPFRQPVPFWRFRVWDLIQKINDPFACGAAGTFLQMRLRNQATETLGQREGHEGIHG